MLDSLYYFKLNPIVGVKTIADVGSGGGFPGIPLAIYFPSITITLIDSVAKKCGYLCDVVAKLGLANVQVLNARAESLSGKRYGLITARAVSSVAQMLAWTSSISSGRWLFYKGTNLVDELAEADIAIKNGGYVHEIMRVEEPFTRTYLYIHR
ncbi:hypothetical protein RsTz2092_11720 [Deferribacterales bacterium RsTz2092]|nr:hypothetical protein AGMMS49941_10040 [Deferribacterales bacterium]